MRLNIFLFCVLCNTAFSQDRISMAKNPGCIYENVLDSIVESVNKEDIEEYSKHFVSFTPKDKISVSLFFLNYEPTVFIYEKHVLKETDTKVELAISYQIDCDVNQKHYVFSSIVTMKKIKDVWKLSREKIINIKVAKANQSESGSGDVCFGGICPLN